jgi:hypothetical protein
MNACSPRANGISCAGDSGRRGRGTRQANPRGMYFDRYGTRSVRSVPR